MKRIAHGLTLVVGLVAWGIGVFGFTLATAAALVGELLMPGRTFGNCWSFALPRYVMRGGYLIIRPADDVRVLGVFRIPHVIWARELPPGMAVEQFVPVKRSHSKWIPWRTVWYEGETRHRERKRRGDPQPDTDWDDLFP